MSNPVPRKSPQGRLTHLDSSGRVRMVDVSGKPVTAREAVARGRLYVAPGTLARLRGGRAPKGDVLTTAHLAGVMAAKRTAEIVPLAHPLALDEVHLAFTLDDAPRPSVGIEARVRNSGRTGCEMEALTAATVAALTLYDMLKAVDRDMVMGDFAIWKKSGGRRGEYRRRG